MLEEWGKKGNKSKSVNTRDPLPEIPDKIIPAPMEVNPQDKIQPEEAPASECQSPMELLHRLARHDNEIRHQPEASPSSNIVMFHPLMPMLLPTILRPGVPLQEP